MNVKMQVSCDTCIVCAIHARNLLSAHVELRPVINIQKKLPSGSNDEDSMHDSLICLGPVGIMV